MNVKESTIELTKKYGWNLLSDPDRLSQMLEFECEDHEREIFCVTLVVRYLLQKIRRISPNVPYVTEDDKERLIRIFYLSDEDANNAIDIVNSAVAVTCDDGVTWFAEPGRLRNVHSVTPKNNTNPVKNSVKSIFIIVLLFIALGLIVYHAESLKKPRNGELTVAFMLPLSHKESNSSYLLLKSAQMAAEKINLQLKFQGGYRLKLLGVNLPTKDEENIAQTKRILKKSSAAAIVSIGGAASERISKIANELEIPIFFTGRYLPRKEALKFGSILAPYTFMLSNNAESKGKALAYFATHGLRKRRIGIVTDLDDQSALEIERSTKKWVRSFGARVVCKSYLNASETNMDAIVEKLQASKPSVIIILGQDTRYRMANFIRTSSNMKSSIVALDYDNIQAKGMNLVDSWWLNEVTDLDVASVSFVSEFESKYGKNVTPVNITDSIMAYDSILFISQMFERATSFRGESLRHTIMSMEYIPLLSGVVTMNQRTHAPLDNSYSLIRIEQSVPVFQRKLKLTTR
ncbi:MAG: ABC transporter substrate-binding protein [Synergistaceae bacterium]|nr:ABC transporter substrate-binding protein [Synergistaceae bacterium]